MSRTFVMGDIHGQLEKLSNLLAKVNFDYDKDKLIQLGDIVDRGPEPFLCIDVLQQIEHVVFIRGNHDAEFLNFLVTGRIHLGGNHGAWQTNQAWYKVAAEDRPKYIQFFKDQLPYYVDEKKRCFVHGGFNRHEPLDKQFEWVLYWDRDLFASALKMEGLKYEDGRPYKFGLKQRFKEVYLGHTPTLFYGTDQPMCAFKKIWNLDTGSGKGGPLTIMDIDTKQYWQA